MNSLVYGFNNLMQGIFESDLESHWLLFAAVVVLFIVVKFINRNFSRSIFLVTVLFVAAFYFFGGSEMVDMK